MYTLLSLTQENQFVSYTGIELFEFYDYDIPFSDLNLLAKFINYTGGMSHEAYDNAH